MIKRLDMVTAVTRVLLDNSTFSEAVTLQRCGGCSPASSPTG